MFVFDSHCKSLQSQTFRPVHPPSGALGSRSQTQKVIAEMLTVKRVDYTQKMVWHFLDPWSMHRWSVHKAWLVLRCQLNIGIFEYLQHLSYPFGIHQCQLIVVLPCGPIVLPKVLWVHHLQVIFDFNTLNMLIFTHAHKTTITHRFHKWCFFLIFVARDNMWIERGFCE